MGCNNSKYHSSEQDYKASGTTIVACKTKDGIVFAVDSRTSNERYQGIPREQRAWHLRMDDRSNKVYTISHNIVAVMAGQVKFCQKMCDSVKDECSELTQHDGMLSVSAVYEKTIKYLQDPNCKDKIFGIIIAGWDNNKGFQVCRAFIWENRILKGENYHYASVGSGHQYANDVIQSLYNYEMSVTDAVELVLKGLFDATLYDKGTGGPILGYHMDKNGCHMKASYSSLEAYCRFYDRRNERNTLFLICSSKRQPFTADDLITCFFRKYGIRAIAGHRVANCVSKNSKLDVAFYFHRLVFSGNEASKVYSQIAAQNGDISRPCDLSLPGIYKKFDYLVWLSTSDRGQEVKVPVYVSWSSKELLQEMLSTSRLVK